MTHIYLDLDETLIHAIPTGRGGIGKRTLINAGGDKYGVLLRPLAKTMLADCRALAHTALITTATRDYALEMNKVFQLGFTEDEIFAREDFIKFEFKNVMITSDAVRENVSPGAVLIDNAEPDYLYARIKRKFLGIPEDNYYQVRTFNGKDPQCFVKEWRNVIKLIQKA